MKVLKIQQLVEGEQLAINKMWRSWIRDLHALFI